MGKYKNVIFEKSIKIRNDISLYFSLKYKLIYILKILKIHIRNALKFVRYSILWFVGRSAMPQRKNLHSIVACNQSFPGVFLSVSSTKYKKLPTGVIKCNMDRSF